MRISDWSSDVCSSDLPGLVGRAGTGRDENRPGAACQRLDRGQRIVALDAHFGPQLDQIMDEVEGEAVVIVDDEDHGALLPVTRHARKPNRLDRKSVV